MLECVHKEIEKCHYTYITQFSPTQQEECTETFQKNCQITFRQEAVTDTVRKSASKSSIRRFVITEKAPTRAFSWLKAATTAFTFKTLLRHYVGWLS